MSNKHHALRHLIHVDAAKAGREILRVIEEAKGHKGEASVLLGCTHGTLLKWIVQADVAEKVEALIARLKETGVCVSQKAPATGPRSFEVVDRKSGHPIGPGGFSTMEAAEAKAAESPKKWRAQRKPPPKVRAARSRARAAA